MRDTAPPRDEGSNPPVADAPVKPSRLRRIINSLWWFHSLFALTFGVGVMMFARKGLDYAESVLVVLSVSWLLIFVAFRVIVGRRNRKPDERLAKKGLRLLTNYVIKQLYQQMFFFLVPLYAVSATWSLSSINWWLAPLLLLCAVLSTMDLVFDNFIMERRVLASAMYGLCMFGVLNLVLPLVFSIEHFHALLIAAAATAPMVALLGFPVRSVISPRGLALLGLLTVGLTVAAFFGRAAIPPAPMTLVHGGIGHGAPGAYECVPGPTDTMSVDRLDHLRCVSEVREPGGLKSPIVHVWKHDGRVIREAIDLGTIDGCGPSILVSRIDASMLPAEKIGRLSCVIMTDAGQLVGRRDVKVVAARAPDAGARGADAGPSTAADGGAVSDAAADAATSAPQRDADTDAGGAAKRSADGDEKIDPDGGAIGD